jgi:hypothetical protein
MRIHSKVAAMALGCVLWSGTAYAGERARPDPKQDDASRGKPRHEKHDKRTAPQQPAGPATGQPQDGTGPAGPATGAPADGTPGGEPLAVLTTSGLQQVTCAILGAPPIGVIQLINSTSEALPVGTIIWFGPPGMAGKDGVTRPSRGTNPDGTPGHMDRYLRLTSQMIPGGYVAPNYSPVPSWPSCTAVIGITSPIPQVAFVE